MEIHIELLLGTKVHDVDGEEVGLIEEFHVQRDESSCRVDA
jgi:sporulation protein YlmC with PRC-barrel domain